MKKIDLQKNRLPKASRWYLLRIIFYVLVVGFFVGFIIYRLNNENGSKPAVNEIHQFSIDSSLVDF